tara:strand:- start:2233 stop:2712 length:480 start_codon:yes stop_codon:yes gene_type:complete
MPNGDKPYMISFFTAPKNRFLTTFLRKVKKNECDLLENVRENVRGKTVVGDMDLLPTRDAKVKAYESMPEDVRLRYWRIMRLMDVFMPYVSELKVIRTTLSNLIVIFQRTLKNLKKYKDEHMTPEERKFPQPYPYFVEDVSLKDEYLLQGTFQKIIFET